jgi:hypothetical protein
MAPHFFVNPCTAGNSEMCGNAVSGCSPAHPSPDGAVDLVLSGQMHERRKFSRLAFREDATWQLVQTLVLET